MAQLVISNITLADGRKSLVWDEDEDTHFGDCNISDTLLNEAIQVVQNKFGSKVINYEWVIDEDEDEEEDED